MNNRSQEAMRRSRFSLVLLVAILCAMAVQVFVWPLALSMQQVYVWFLAFGLGALAAAIGAGWDGTLLASDHSHSHLPLVFGISEATAAVVAVIGFLVLHTSVVESSILLSVLSFLVAMAVVVLAASWATLRFRSPGRPSDLDLITTLGLVGLAVLVYFGTLFLAPLPM